MKAIVLAGERPGGNALAGATGAAAGVLVPVAGRPGIVRVIDTLRAARGINGGVIVGPEREVCRGSRALNALFEAGDFSWIEPDRGPAESTLRALDAIGDYPVFVTTGDHALLAPATVERFLSAGAASNAQAVVGLVRHASVIQRFPDTRRTRLRFREGGYCSTNLFLLREPRARQAVRFWTEVQRDRKRPWRIAKRLGPVTLARYLCGRLAMADAFARLSRSVGCAVSWVEVSDERAAVDVDSVQDLALAERLLAAPIHE